MSTIGLEFGETLKYLREGEFVTRQGWNGRGQYIYFVPQDGKIREFLMIHTVQGTEVPWVASQTDLLASDWQTIDKETLKNG